MATNKKRIILVFQRVSTNLRRIDPNDTELCIAYGDGVSTAPKLRERVLDRLQMGGTKLVLIDKSTGIDVDVEDELIPSLRGSDAYESLPSMFTTELTDSGDLKVHLLVIDERQPSTPSGGNDKQQREAVADDKHVRRASGASSTGVAGSGGSESTKKEKPKYAAELNTFIDKLVDTVAPVEEIEVI